MLEVSRGWLRLSMAWAAFVFIPFNLFAGTLIAKEFSASEAVLGLFFGSVALCILTVPAVLYASMTGRTYAQAIEYEVSNRLVGAALKVLVPLVNIGWFSIQTIAAVQLLPVPEGSRFLEFLSYAGVAILFIAGPIFGGYVWLYRFGFVAVIAMVLGMVVIVGSGSPTKISWEAPSWANAANASLLVLGTWIFSSTTCVMDVARELRRPKAAITAILCGTLIADVSLMGIGFLYPDFAARFIGTSNQQNSLAILGSIFVIIALWSTNDSNFYSTERALLAMGVSSAFTAILVVGVTGIVGVCIGGRLFNVIGPWLQVMGWIGIPMGLFWLSKCLRFYRSPCQ